MKILVDENIPIFTISHLRSMGHDVLDIRGTELEGSGDSIIWKIALDQGRLLISTDKGFVHYHYQNKKHKGIILVLLKQPKLIKIHERIINAIIHSNENSFLGTVLIIKDNITARRS